MPEADVGAEVGTGVGSDDEAPLAASPGVATEKPSTP
jgi:hypothetical protein